MANRVILDGNASYEVDEECLKQNKAHQNTQMANQEVNQKNSPKERLSPKNKNRF